LLNVAKRFLDLQDFTAKTLQRILNEEEPERGEHLHSVFSAQKKAAKLKLYP
jgi:hypothetical protein